MTVLTTLTSTKIMVFLLSILVVHPLHAADVGGSIECGIYLAPSSIPFAGLGMYAGNRSIALDEVVTDGDILIPIVERPWHIERSLNDRKFLWNEYIWTGNTFDFTNEEIGEELVGDISMASPGVGAAANSYMSMINIDDNPILISRAGLSRNSPGQGAFTIYHGRSFVATEPIEPGQELFVSYGNNYFTSRKHTYGYLPMPSKDYDRADFILEKGLDLILHNTEINSDGRQNGTCSPGHGEDVSNNKDNNNCDVLLSSETIREEIWNDVHALIKDISGNIYTTSRILNAIPANVSVIEDVLEGGGTAYQDYNRSVKGLEWLEENGQCMDNIKSDLSKIPHAGRGAFATRFIPSGRLVSPAPLVHIEDIDNMVMFMDHIYNEEDRLVPNRRGEYTWQLILNYCFAHHQSTLLLCPYGLLSSLINHSTENFNTKIQWSEDHRMRHPEWFNNPLDEWSFEYHTGLQIDFVATRDIKADEEILIDYGPLWQNAWANHVEEFKFEEYRSELYMPAYELNDLLLDDDDFKLRTEKDREYELDGVRMFVKINALPPLGSRWGEHDHACTIVRKLYDDSYLIRLVKWVDDDEYRVTERDPETFLLWGIPKGAFFFEDLPYTRDIHQQWSFRHPMMIPDDLFPDIWKNVNNDNSDIPFLQYAVKFGNEESNDEEEEEEEEYGELEEVRIEEYDDDYEEEEEDDMDVYDYFNYEIKEVEEDDDTDVYDEEEHDDDDDDDDFLDHDYEEDDEEEDDKYY